VRRDAATHFVDIRVTPSIRNFFGKMVWLFVA
jgi:hypothetical protein